MESRSNPGTLIHCADANRAPTDEINEVTHPHHAARWREIAVGLALAAAGTCNAADDRVQVGYEYATWLGTGAYEVTGRDIFILRMPFFRDLRKPAPDQFGIRILLPISVGWLDTEDVFSQYLQTATFIPGVELDFEVNPRWHLGPYVQAGLGTDFSGGDLAWIGAAGIKSRYSFERGAYRFSIGNGLVVAASRPAAGGDSTRFTRFEAGLAVSRAMHWTLADRGTRLSAFYIASFFADGAVVLQPELGTEDIGTAQTAGVALDLDRPLRFLGLEIGSLGLSYLNGDGLRGVRLNAGFPF
jgi:hypothetical protein